MDYTEEPFGIKIEISDIDEMIDMLKKMKEVGVNRYTFPPINHITVYGHDGKNTIILYETDIGVKINKCS